MMGPRIEPRGLRAVLAVAAACIVLIATGVLYLHPLPPGRSAPRPTPAASTAGPPIPRILTISFGDTDHGAVTLLPLTSGFSPASTWLTEDGGRTWRRFAAPATGPGIVIFDGPRHAAAEPSEPGSTVVTSDGGRTWRTMPVPGQGWLTFLDAEHAWLVQPLGRGPTGPPMVVLWRTSDGGASWQQLAAFGPPAGGPNGGLSFVDPQHGLLVRGTAGGALVSLLATVDGGASWQPAATFESPIPGALLLSAGVFEHGGRLLAVPLWVTGAAVGPEGTGVQLLGNAVFHPTVSISDDAGRTWSPLRAGPPVDAAFNSVAGPALDDHGRLVMFDHGRLWVSEDSGTTWRARSASLPRGMEIAGTIIPAPGALFVAARAGGLAPPSELLRSRDGGSHWSLVRLPEVPA